ncbi:MAG: ribosome small subunit-dependent GTPase A [Clostridiales bacterium]|nr:ribosome small subunit-dependent GTPase A [Clostridiales bacterium]
MTNGIILKGIGGFYYVETADGIFECKARGIFRKKNITPLVGDRVRISVNENAENTIDEIMQRKNFLIRPPLANIDTLFVVSSMVSPAVNTFVIDRLVAVAEHREIEPVIVFTKTDIDPDYKEYYNIYSKAGFKTIVCDNTASGGVDEIRELLKGETSAFTGNTGVGKSTLINLIEPSLSLATGQTSSKFGRGRHTTRHYELFKICGGYVADTPGFSVLDIEKGETIRKEELAYCFREFVPYLDECRFAVNCSHINDKGCAVKKAVEDGIISQSRHNSYVQMYNEIKDIKEWERR